MSCEKVSLRSNPKLWEEVKKQVLKGNKGGVPNKWSARKAQLSTKLYKSRGGKYKGVKSKCNSLTKWSNEKWDYINHSRKKGRYLPEKVRKSLTKKEKILENKLKGSRKGERVKYSPTVLKKMRLRKIF